MREQEQAFRPRLRGAAVTAFVCAVVLTLACVVEAGLAGWVTGERMPRPRADGAQEFLRAHDELLLGIGGLYLLAAGALLVFGLVVPRAVPSERRLGLAHLAAVAALTVAAGAGLALAFSGAMGSERAVQVLHATLTVVGGPVHVATLGLYVLALSRSAAYSPPERVIGVVAAVVAVMGLLALPVVPWGPVSTAGRILCLVWLLVTTNRLALRSPY
ncbi:hypothetical protein EXU48_01370 [Occultella glacieicola]|uniref:DUF998 domain-containing protein n=1 Tax=Occultella glacieicola TaxID=2518684 RepID=A0ABY2E8N4_9MICO|nr:hypothetical protein [Occultella glacieicola]TDE98876.1 hypothetical protein EXU48_01370 [Occultella glacieicola]